MSTQPKGVPQEPPPPAYENPISLKVMRLSKPKFHFGLPVPFIVPPADTSASETSIAESAELVDPALSGMLSLPHSFGDIYLGETFSCFVSLANKSALELVQVALKVEVRTEYNRESISEERSVDRLPARQTLDKVVHYELKDTGMHILSCLALYTDPSGEKKHFKKFYKFQVNNPLKMKEKTHELIAHQDIIVETQVQNATPRTLFLESVRFIPAPQFDVFCFAEHGVRMRSDGPEPSDGEEDASSSDQQPPRAVGVIADGSVTTGTHMTSLGPMAYLKEGDVEQFMFRLRGKLPSSQLKRTTALGRMEVVWKSTMGEPGRLQSNVVQRKLPGARAVEVNVTSVPHEVALETPFDVQCVATNTSSKEVQLFLHFEPVPGRTGGFVFDGVSGRGIGSLAPYATLTFSFSLIALDTGILKLNGLYLFDAISEQRFDVVALADIFVQPAEEVHEVENTSGSARTKGAAYLTFSTENSGMLSLNWSDKPVDGALAAFVPKVPVSRFKFTTNNGRTELIRDCGGVKVRRFYEGFAMFLKTARSFDGKFTHISNLPKLQVAIYFNDEKQAVTKVPVGPQFVTFESVKAAAIIPLLDPSLNVRTMQTRMFQQVAEKVGATVAFDGGGTGRRSGRADVGFLKKSDTPKGETKAEEIN